MSDSPKKFPPSVTVARLYERTSKTGNTYLAGRLGLSRVAILKTSATDDDGNPIWEVRISEAPQSDKQEAKTGSRAQRDWQRPSHVTTEPIDPIPF